MALAKELDVLSFLVTSNTEGGQKPMKTNAQGLLVPALDVPRNIGGMSGPSRRHVGEAQLVLVDKLKKGLGLDVELISTQGVATGRDLSRRLELGAVAAGSVTAFWRANDPRMKAVEMLSESV